MRISDWSSDVCSSDLLACELRHHRSDCASRAVCDDALSCPQAAVLEQSLPRSQARDRQARAHREIDVARQRREVACLDGRVLRQRRSEEHTSELQSLMRISYAVFCLKK